MIISDACSSQLHSPVRTIKARVELYEGSTLLSQFCYGDALISFDVQRVGESKFFGFGICHRLNVHLIDTNRELNISTANNLDISFGAGCEYIYPFPNFYVSEVHRDENTNELSITAYDAIYKASEHTVSELGLEYYTIREFAAACAKILGLPMKISVNDETVFDTYYAAGANFDGSENLREALNAVAEATQTIYYLDNNWNLTFKRLDRDGEPVITIDKEHYIELDSKTNRRLSRIVSATELGDNVEGQMYEIKTASGTDSVVIDTPRADVPVETQLESKNLIDVPVLDATADKNKVLFEGELTGSTVFSCEFNYSEIKTPGAAQFEFVVDGAVQYMARGSSTRMSKKIEGKLTKITFLNWGYGVGTVNDIQLEWGTAATAYTPYMDDFSGVNITRLGKNLFDYTQPKANGASNIISQKDGVVEVYHKGTGKWSSANILIPNCRDLVGKKITISGKAKTSGANSAAMRVMWLTDTGGGTGSHILTSPYISSTEYTYISRTGVVPEQPTAEHSNLCLMLYGNVDATITSGDYYAWYKDIQIEVGETATEYTPYKEPATATANVDGTVDGLLSVYPATTLISDTDGAVFHCGCRIPVIMSGTTQYVRDNPFWALREDIGTLVDKAAAAMYGFTIHQFDCSWRGNFLVEIGDKIALITKDNETIYSYLLNDTIKYDGSFSQKTEWQYEDNESETAANPSSLGDLLNQTYARVDKQNREIELLASQVEDTKQSVAQLNIDTDSIMASVNSISKTTTDAFDGIHKELADISQQVSLSLNSEEAEILIQKQISNGVSSVETTTGFTFNEEGLTVSKSESDISTMITEDGMRVYNKNKEVLTANNEGVRAIDLHATTYLAIGKYSRFEDYGSKKRTACYWIGG